MARQNLIPPRVGCEVIATTINDWAGKSGRVLECDDADDTMLVRFHHSGKLVWMHRMYVLRIDSPPGVKFD